MGPERELTMWILAGVGGLLALVAAVAGLVWLARGPRAGKVVARRAIDLGAPFDWTLVTANEGPHVLWMRISVAFEGSEDADVGLRLFLRTDEGPERRILYRCEPEPGDDAGMRGAWMTRLRTDGAGHGTYEATLWVCGFRPRAAGTPVRLRGRLEGRPNVTSGTAELRFARR